MSTDEQRIHILNEETINQIAAGEVIERPASVIKELAENAIDSGAKRIEIDISSTKGNITRIQVTDDGSGMSRQDAELAFTPHATSKIQSIDDLLRCVTLGFRGEALASIGAIAKVTLTTKPRGALAGTRVVVRGGSLLGISDAGVPEGTSMTVEELFYNTPARLKFQKSLQSELSRITGIVEGLALTHPEISFRMIHNKRDRCDTVASGDLKETIISLYGTDLAALLVPVRGDHHLVRIRGYISRPSLSRPNPYQMNISVNNRHVHSLPLIASIKEGYGTLLAKDTYPVVFLNLEIDGPLVDVNVHPTKRQVRIGREREITAAISDVVWSALKGEDLITRVQAGDTPGETRSIYGYPPGPAGHVREASHPFLLTTDRQLRQTELPVGTEDQPGRLPHMTVIGQYADSYIVAKSGTDELLLIDQHAAHERILYEQVIEKSGSVLRSQELIVPVIIRLSPRESALVQEIGPALETEGFIIEEFGRDQVAVRAVPVVLGRLEDELVIHELVAELLEEDIRGVPGRREQICRIIACRGALKAETPCTPEQCERLIKQLARTKNPFSCPHGRPTIISFPRDKIDRMFKRT
jgi:DNA mismatch repair protein MutL